MRVITKIHISYLICVKSFNWIDRHIVCPDMNFHRPARFYRDTEHFTLLSYFALLSLVYNKIYYVK